MLRYGSPLWLIQMELRHRSERVSLREPHLSDYATILLKDVIASHAPDLSAVHLVDLDDMRHHHGVFNRETRKAIQRLDHRAAEIWETMQHTPHGGRGPLPGERPWPGGRPGNRLQVLKR